MRFGLVIGLLCALACGDDESDTKTSATTKHDHGYQDDAGAVLPEKHVARAVADYLIATWPELDREPSDCSGPANCFSMNFATVPAGPAPKFWEYTYGVPLVGIQKLYELTHDEKYLAFVQKYVDRYVDDAGVIDYGKPWPNNPDGKAMAPNDPTIQDVIQPANLLFGLYETTHAEKYLNALASVRAVFERMQKNPDGAFFHKPSYPNQQWLDGIYMSEPLLVRFGRHYAEQLKHGDSVTCFDTALDQIALAAKNTYDERTELYFHAWNGAPDGVWLGLAPPAKTAPLTGTRVSPVLWARSLGWLAAGTVDVLENLPSEHPRRPELQEILEHIAHGLGRYQDPATGLFYQALDVMDGPLPARGGYPDELDRPAHENWLETSASALFAYSLAKAVRLGVLHDDALAIAHKAWKGVLSKVDVNDDGSVHIHGVVVGMSVGGTYNAYTNADFRSDLTSGDPPAPGGCPGAADLPLGTSSPDECKYSYVRDDVPQGFGAVLLAASELER